MTASTTCTNLLNLNTKCLMEILSQDCLAVLDLCSVAETCRLLKDVDKVIISRDQTFRVLTHFGSFISGIHFLLTNLSDKYYRNEMDQVIKYCSNLKRVWIVHCTPTWTSASNGDHCSNLEFICYDGSYVCDAQHLFSNCKSVVELSVADEDYNGGATTKAILPNSFPKLERFVLHSYELGPATLFCVIRIWKRLKFWLSTLSLYYQQLSAI